MQIESLRVISHRSWRVDDASGPVARERLRRLELFDELRAAGCDEAPVLTKRDERPLWGKRKIGAALRRDVAGFDLSDSGVGRILSRAMQRGRTRRQTTKLPNPNGVLSTPQKGRLIVSNVLNLYSV